MITHNEFIEKIRQDFNYDLAPGKDNYKILTNVKNANNFIDIEYTNTNNLIDLKYKNIRIAFLDYNKQYIKAMIKDIRMLYG